jgi:hypothetical protein
MKKILGATARSGLETGSKAVQKAMERIQARSDALPTTRALTDTGAKRRISLTRATSIAELVF